ncbi:MAG: YifB family Mg chelatase-like AAA ATPase [Phycisphaerales bacterium JB064]
MPSKIRSFLLRGVEADPCEVEVDLDDAAMAKETIVGLPDAAIRESIERVRAALTNTGYAFPNGRLVINLAPAHVRKEGPIYDLPIAVALLQSTGVIRGHRPDDSPPRLHKCMIAGELALDGRVRPIRGVIAMADLAKHEDLDAVIVPAENAAEAAVAGPTTYGVNTLAEVVGLLNGVLDIEPQAPPDLASMLHASQAPIDFAEVRGQEAVKRSIVVAAAGGHNVIMLGPAGTGKTMMARALPGVLPPMTSAEAIEITRIHSAAGELPPGQGLVASRPVRTPHHTASAASIVGGGIVPRPGEVSLATHGILFMDELPEFPRSVLETLRQPLEDHVVTISRSRGTVRFPANFLFVAAMNPAPGGSAGASAASQKAAERYRARISGPLLDRIDIHVEAPAVPWKELSATGGSSTDSATMRDRVLRARSVQAKRQGEGKLNGRLRGKELDTLAPMSDPARSLLGQAIAELGLSARAYDKVRRVARTVADLEGAEGLDVQHIAEAVQYRLLDRG